MRYIFLIAFSALSLSFVPVQAFAQSESIAAVVNEDAISKSDVGDRMKLIVLSSGLPNSPEIREKLTPQVLTSLIEEQLKLQEAKRLEIEVTPEEVDEGFAMLAAQNKIPAEKFKEMLNQSGINLVTMQRQIRAQMAWTKIIQAKMRPKVLITDNDIDEVIRRLEGTQGMTEYLLGEIALPVDNPEQENDVRSLADKLSRDIRSGQAPFIKVAQQFSQAAGAAQGGDLGWVQASQLPPDIADALKSANKGDITAPIRSLTGYHILYVRDVRTITKDSIPERDKILSTLGVERLDRMQRRYLQDLKTGAFIETRI